MNIAGHEPKPWISANLSERWYRDTSKEAGGNDVDATRREIVFAASFLESYIFEWVRTIDFDGIDIYFPPGGKQKNAKEKWKQIPEMLFERGKINKAPQLDLSQLGSLVLYRNGLVHAGASRPWTQGRAPKEQPVPAIDELHTIEHGWALRVARKLVIKLHSETRSSPPSWINP